MASLKLKQDEDLKNIWDLFGIFYEIEKLIKTDFSFSLYLH